MFDFESVLKKLDNEATEKLEWTHHHIPISVSVCSNIAGHDRPQCFVNENIDELLKSMIFALTDIQLECTHLAQLKWGPFMESLKESLRSLDEDEEDDRAEIEKVKKLMGKLKAYISNIPVLGFNSSKYDLNLVKSKLAKHLNLNEQEHGFTVKKANAYACIATDAFKFLDISHFLAPGTSYAMFLKAYGVEENKGVFPYEWFDDVEKLQQSHLPPKEAFYSSLKGVHISDDDYKICEIAWYQEQMHTFLCGTTIWMCNPLSWP